MDLTKEGLNISKGDYICLLDGDDYHSNKHNFRKVFKYK